MYLYFCDNHWKLNTPSTKESPSFREALLSRTGGESVKNSVLARKGKYLDGQRGEKGQVCTLAYLEEVRQSEEEGQVPSH